jgi:hypothetical protein
MEAPATAPVVGRRLFTDGRVRPVYADGERQYVLGDDGERVYGVWLLPADEPVVVEERG